MNIIIRKAVTDDFPEIFSMINELAEFENAPEKVMNSVEQMIDEKDLFFAFIAKNKNGDILGYAIFYFVYYTWVGKSLYLDDLFVKEKYRGKGAGSKLLDAVIGFARNENCRRIRWQVLDWNTPAIDIYKKLGASLDSEWINCDYK